MSNNKQKTRMITAYDIALPSEVVGSNTSPERWVSAQPPGYEAILKGSGRELSWFVSRVGNRSVLHNEQCANMKQVRQTIANVHNHLEATFYRKAAIAWVRHYLDHPEDKRNTDPRLVASIYLCAARARLHPDDEVE